MPGAPPTVVSSTSVRTCRHLEAERCQARLTLALPALEQLRVRVLPQAVFAVELEARAVAAAEGGGDARVPIGDGRRGGKPAAVMLDRAPEPGLAQARVRDLARHDAGERFCERRIGASEEIAELDGARASHQ